MNAWQMGYEQGKAGKVKSNPYPEAAEHHRKNHGQYEIGYDYGRGELLLERRMKWDLRFLGLLEREVAQWSKDPSTKCGCAIVRPDYTVAALGFNGFPRGMRDDPELYADREVKYSRVIHAEMNALLTAREPVVGYTAYTWPIGPCDRCAVHLIQAGIARVVFPCTPQDKMERWDPIIKKSLTYFAEANVGFSIMSLGG